MRDLTFSYVWSNKHTVNLSGRPPLCCTDLVCAVYQKLNIFQTTVSKHFCICFEIYEKLALVLNKVQRRHKRVYDHLFINFGRLELNGQRTYLRSAEVMASKLGPETGYISRDISWISSRPFRSLSVE